MFNSVRAICLCFLICSVVSCSTSGVAQETEVKKLNAAHILIAYDGAMRSQATRTKEEAKALAGEVAKLAQAEGADFAALAKEHSDGPSKTGGGNLGNFAPDQMVPPFSAATLKLEIGQVSEPVESKFGFHVSLRKEVELDLAAAHILISHAGAMRSAQTRTEEEALKLANEVAALASAEGADFAELAKTHSDGPSGRNGGDLGVFPPGQMIPEFSAATKKLQIGEVSKPVKTDFGYHIILRKELPPPPETASAKHILVQWKGSGRAGANITRTKEEALARLNECIAKLKEGTEFEALAEEYSDGPSGPRGGDLGKFERGQMVAEFDKVLFEMEVGTVSDVVETMFGYHIIYRY